MLSNYPLTRQHDMLFLSKGLLSHGNSFGFQIYFRPTDAKQKCKLGSFSFVGLEQTNRDTG